MKVTYIPCCGIEGEESSVHSFLHRQSLPAQDTNLQSSDYESNSLPLGHDFPWSVTLQVNISHFTLFLAITSLYPTFLTSFLTIVNLNLINVSHNSENKRKTVRCNLSIVIKNSNHLYYHYIVQCRKLTFICSSYQLGESLKQLFE